MARDKRDIIFAADCSDAVMEGLVDVYLQATYEGGQHDLINCRICHAEQNWRTGVMTHKPSCPVGKVTQLLSEFD